MDKILLVGTGGTIACVKGDSIHLDSAFKILDYTCFDNVEFECASPFTILSENMNFGYWQMLVDYLKTVDLCKYKGIIILHGSDTLTFTGALLANVFYDKPIVLVASDKPLEDKTANGIENFERAVNAILSGINRVHISYDRLYQAENNEPLEKPVLSYKNILAVKPYVNIDYSNYNLENVDVVLHEMYHSATAPENVKGFMSACSDKNIPFYFVTENSSADYESAKDFENIIFNSTLEGAYARLLLTSLNPRNAD